MMARVDEAELFEEMPQQLRYVTHRIWFYVNDDARCFIVAPRGPDGFIPVRFCLNENRSYEDLYRKVLVFMKDNILTWTYSGWDVYFQVAPMVKNPTKEPVQVSMWLPVNLDYKRLSPMPLSLGCQEGEGHSLKCSYQGMKGWIYVERPPLGQVLEEVKQKMKARPALVVDSGTGYHLYFRVDGELTLDEFKLALSYVTNLFEKQPNTYPGRMMRMPGTIHPETGRMAKVIWESDDTVDFIWLLSEAEANKPVAVKKEKERGIKTWM